MMRIRMQASSTEKSIAETLRSSAGVEDDEAKAKAIRGEEDEAKAKAKAKAKAIRGEDDEAKAKAKAKAKAIRGEDDEAKAKAKAKAIRGEDDMEDTMEVNKAENDPARKTLGKIPVGERLAAGSRGKANDASIQTRPKRRPEMDAKRKRIDEMTVEPPAKVEMPAKVEKPAKVEPPAKLETSEDTEDLHPSWAAKRQKQVSIQGFSGTRVQFDSDGE